jgi:signal recognition particle GTPase
MVAADVYRPASIDHCMLVAADVYRPASIDQLTILYWVNRYLLDEHIFT